MRPQLTHGAASGGGFSQESDAALMFTSDPQPSRKYLTHHSHSPVFSYQFPCTTNDLNNKTERQKNQRESSKSIFQLSRVFLSVCVWCCCFSSFLKAAGSLSYTKQVLVTPPIIAQITCKLLAHHGAIPATHPAPTTACVPQPSPGTDVSF